MRAHAYRLPVAILAAALAAGGATLLLRPRSGVVQPAAASATDYFTSSQLQKAHDFRAPQRVLALGSLALEGAVLVWIVVRPPRAVRRALERANARPVRGAAVVGAAGAVAMTLIQLPLSAISHQRARDVGLATQTWPPWLGDLAKSTAIGAVMTGAGAAIAIALIRRFPRHWWIPGAAAVVGISTLLVFASPVVIDPIFNKFEPLPPGKLRSEVLALADKADVDVGQVYRVDASRRTTATNAYVWGIGGTKRVVIYDNLIKDFPDDQVRSVVAHELSHVVHKDVPRGLLWLAIVAPAGTLLIKVLAERFNRGRPLGLPAALPALALAMTISSTALGIASNVLSRRVEARADTYALDLTRDPAAFIGLTRSLAVTNLSDPSTPQFFQTIWGTHPTTMQRIGAGLEWAREH
jgi:Zn-dependent protease with chaperone function